jgi:hypothetical protein
MEAAPRHDDAGEVARAFEGCPSETAEAGRAGVCEACPGKSLCQAGLAPDPGTHPPLLFSTTNLLLLGALGSGAAPPPRAHLVGVICR